MAELTSPTFQCTNPDCLRTYSVDPGMCGGCGMSDFRQVGEPEPEVPVRAPTPPAVIDSELAEARQQELFCLEPGCGQAISAGQEFCDYCGTPIIAVPHVDPGPGATTAVYLRAGDGTRIPFTVGREIVLGRSPDHSPWSRIFDGHNGVSRRHAVVVFDGTNVHIRDEGSSNGTFVNRIRIDGSATLAPADLTTIGLGRNYQITVETDE